MSEKNKICLILDQILAEDFTITIGRDEASDDYFVTASFDDEEWNRWAGPDLEAVLLKVAGWATTIEDEVSQVED